MLLAELREELVFYCQEMLKTGLTMHTGGNLSARDPKTGLLVIKPSSMPYPRMRPQDVPVIDEHGRIIAGDVPPSTEWPMHTLIYRRRPRVMGIVHTHSPYATACSVAGLEIPLINHELAVYTSEPVRSAPFQVPGTVELGEGALEYMGEGDVVLLQNHGPLAVGATLWHAYDAACAVEQAAFSLFMTRMFGSVVPIPPFGLRALREGDPLAQPDTGAPPVIKSV